MASTLLERLYRITLSGTEDSTEMGNIYIYHLYIASLKYGCPLEKQVKLPSGDIEVYINNSNRQNPYAYIGIFPVTLKPRQEKKR